MKPKKVLVSSCRSRASASAAGGRVEGRGGGAAGGALPRRPGGRRGAASGRDGKLPPATVLSEFRPPARATRHQGDADASARIFSAVRSYGPSLNCGWGKATRS